MSPVPIFLLSLFILHTGVTSDLEEEKQALLSFMGNLSLPISPHYKYRWDPSTSPCSWNGVYCGLKYEFIMHLRLPAASLVGEIQPHTIGKLPGLRTLSLHHNGLRGPIPPDVFNLTHLTQLILDHNHLTGDIDDLKSLKLEVLDVSNNHLNGTIPTGFSKLTSLSRLFLNNNDFSGHLPEINSKDLEYFNASNNRLNTSIPKSLSKFRRSAFSHNIYVCDHPYVPCNHTSSSPPSITEPLVTDKKAKNKRPMIVSVSVASAVLLLILVCCLRKNVCPQRRQLPPSEANLAGEISSKLVLFDDGIQGFGLEDLLKGSADVLGNGSVGMSYKQTMIRGKTTTTVVVKRLKDVVVNEEEFEATMEVLGKMKNKYVVPLKAFYCSKYEKWVVYDYMPAGSLSAHLHGSTSSSQTQLDWDCRMRIALAAARGLAYLHVPGKVVHGNIKSSNILLRQETNNEASVSDYGLNMLFGGRSFLNNGYRAPEVLEAHYVTFESDVYSFGVLLLEILTGETPKQTSFGGKHSKWVESLIVSEEPKAEMFDMDLRKGHNIEEMIQLWRIAKECVSIVPDQRPKMHDVVSMMEDMWLRPSSDDHSKEYDFTPSTEIRDTPSTISP